MANTTNFGWETPDDTDLVKDGAAAMRTLGNAIDASLVDLKGGTTGQVLAKNSNTDLDFTWTNGGDITEVAAGVGISGGGTSGNVTITNSMATAIDAKGDLVVGTGADTFARLASSNVNDQVLTVDTATSTGLKWAAVPTGGMTQLASGSLSGSTVTLSGISGSYNHLELTLRGVSTSANAYVRLTFNGVATGYTFVGVDRNGSTVGTTATFVDLNLASQFINAGQTDAAFFVQIFDYATTNRKKGSFFSSFQDQVPNTIGLYGAFGCKDVTNAITSIEIFPSTGTFDAGTYVLWGVK